LTAFFDEVRKLLTEVDTFLRVIGNTNVLVLSTKHEHNVYDHQMASRSSKAGKYSRLSILIINQVINELIINYI